MLADRGRSAVIPARDTHLALAATLAARALDEARVDYTASRFAACAAKLEAAEQRLASSLVDAADFPLLRQVNQWLGLCLAVSGGEQAAARAFIRAKSLPGSAPSEDLFPPKAMELYRASERAAGACDLVLEDDMTDGVLIDGSGVTQGSRISLGEHYVVSRHGSSRGQLASDCRLWPVSAGKGAPVLSPVEAADLALLGAVASRVGADRVHLFDDSGGRSYSVVAGHLEVEAPTCPTVPSAAVIPAQEESSEGLPWWVWALGGAAVASAATLAITAAASPAASPRATEYMVRF